MNEERESQRDAIGMDEEGVRVRHHADNGGECDRETMVTDEE